MSTGVLAYKESPAALAEVLDLDERLWDHIRIATSLVDRQRQHRGSPAGAASAVMVRSQDGEPVVVVLVDRGTEPPAGGAADIRQRFGLTARESDVARLLAERLSCREIAERLGMGFSTARTHTERVLTKLGVRSKNDVRLRIQGTP
ncbi:MAG: response regulator transcription factor [Gemmatimonadota bacterium]